MAYRWEARSATPGDYRWTEASISEIGGGGTVYGAVISRVLPAIIAASTAGVEGVLYGNHFGTASTITVGGTSATTTEVTDELIRFTFPSKVVGKYNLVVTNPTTVTTDTLTDGVEYVTPGTPILTLAEVQLKVLIEDMSIATGYHFDWGTATVYDEALGTALVSLIEPVNPFELNKDNPYGAHSGAYLNECQYKITVRPKLTTEEALPNWQVRAFWNKAVDDLKKRFGLDDGSTLNGTVQHFAYMRTMQFIERAGDVFKPGRIEVYFRCVYHQDRADPSINA